MPNSSGYKQATAPPTRKVVFGGIAGAVTVIAVWILNEFKILPDGTQIPGEIASAATTLLTFVVSYIVPPAASDNIVPDESG